MVSKSNFNTKIATTITIITVIFIHITTTAIIITASFKITTITN